MSAMDERRGGVPDDRGRDPAVVCTDCGFGWHSAAMASGLRLLGSCPRCGGELDFAVSPAEGSRPEPVTVSGAPHLALGLPRPPDRA